MGKMKQQNFLQILLTVKKQNKRIPLHELPENFPQNHLPPTTNNQPSSMEYCPLTSELIIDGEMTKLTHTPAKRIE